MINIVLHLKDEYLPAACCEEEIARLPGPSLCLDPRCPVKGRQGQVCVIDIDRLPLVKQAQTLGHLPGGLARGIEEPEGRSGVIQRGFEQNVPS
jgi:hypothetical protein